MLLDLCYMLHHFVRDASIELNRSIIENSRILGVNSNLAKSFVCQDQLVVECYSPNNLERPIEVVKRAIWKYNFQLSYAQRLIYQRIRLIPPVSEGFVEELLTIQGRYQKAVVVLTAKLFAELEWVNIWARGQRRTDLILLNGLLSREGLHPAILSQSHYSICNSSEKWIEYLGKGLKQYEEEFAAQG